MIKVFVVDDSAIVRQTLAHLLAGDPEISLLGSAPNPLLAAPLLRRQRPDVLLLDIEMPGMDGISFLRQLMAESPLPTVICSTLTTAGSQAAVEALAAEAVAVVAKPRLGLKQFLQDSRREIVQALEEVLTALPADAPGIAAVLHMPEKFTAMYAQRLDGLCAMRVREARDGDRLERGTALIAPGGRHLSLRKAGGQYFVGVADGPPVNRHKPAVDVLFRSAAECAGAEALALLLTGMGDDGARGMQRLRAGGARTLAQDEASCVVFGMPKEAIKLGAVDEVLPLDRMAAAILQFDARG